MAEDLVVDPIHALFFDSKGNGPDDIAVSLKPLRKFKDSDSTSLGIMVDEYPPRGFTRMVAPGGFLLARASVVELHRRLGAWLEANPS